MNHHPAFVRGIKERRTSGQFDAIYLPRHASTAIARVEKHGRIFWSTGADFVETVDLHATTAAVPWFPMRLGMTLERGAPDPRDEIAAGHLDQVDVATRLLASAAGYPDSRLPVTATTVAIADRWEYSGRDENPALVDAPDAAEKEWVRWVSGIWLALMVPAA